MKTLWTAAIIALLAGCRHPGLGRPVLSRGGGYVYVQTGAVYEVVAQGQAGLREAMARICGPNVCTVEAVGEAYVVRVEPGEKR